MSKEDKKSTIGDDIIDELKKCKDKLISDPVTISELDKNKSSFLEDMINKQNDEKSKQVNNKEVSKDILRGEINNVLNIMKYNNSVINELKMLWDTAYSFTNNVGNVLSDLDIKKEYISGNIIIEPYNESQVNNCSYDITLGSYYFSNKDTSVRILNPLDKETVNKYWGKALEAFNTSEYHREVNLIKDAKYISLYPGEMILAHTNEFIGANNNITTMLKCKSTLARCGISICLDAGWGDVGYVNRWCLEIHNFSNVRVMLQVGMRIGQIVFLRTGQTSFTYSDKGSYQNKDKIKDIMDNWKPEDLLPKVK